MFILKIEDWLKYALKVWNVHHEIGEYRGIAHALIS